jgi:hypothetical protein
MLEFAARAARDEEEPATIGEGDATVALRDVRPDRVCDTNELHTNGPTIEGPPAPHGLADVVGERNRRPVDGQLLETPLHASTSQYEQALAPWDWGLGTGD